MLNIRVDRHRCLGAGNCITLTPTAFDWLPGNFGKAELIDPSSIDEELLRESAMSCPTQAIIIEELQELLPWQMREVQVADSQHVVKTFMFTDIEKSTNLVEVIGDQAWESLLRWHDQTLRSVFAAFHGEEAATTGDGFFVGFETPESAIACAIAIQRKLAEHRQEHGFAPQVRIGLHASDATMKAGNFSGKGVHEAARIASLANGGEIFASKATVGSDVAVSNEQTVTLKGITEPMTIVTVNWS
ncbi:MAG: adenylate/guanylate cyclase domain-containing protein [Dehalococcoidia bacterium]